jgi:hypothetical protein
VASTPIYGGLGLPDVVMNPKVTEEPGLLGYDAVVLGGFRHCERRDNFIFKGKDVLKIRLWKMITDTLCLYFVLISW